MSSFIQRRLSDTKAVSAALVIALFGQIVLGTIVHAAVIQNNKVGKQMFAFQIANTTPVSVVLPSGQQTGGGAFGEGQISRFPEGSCIPTLVKIENEDTQAGDILFSPSYDYSKSGIIGVDHFEAVASPLGAAVATADDLNDFQLGLADLSTVVSFGTLSGGSVQAEITGPLADDVQGGVTMKKYDVVLKDVPAGETVLFLSCARLGVDASEFSNGSDLSLRLSGGQQNMAIAAGTLSLLPTLTLVKKVMNDGPDAADAWSFTATPAIQGYSNPLQPILNLDGTASITIEDVQPNGEYSFSENGPGGYTMSLGDESVNCSYITTGSFTAYLVPDFPARNVTCVFVNTFNGDIQAPDPATLIVTKQFVEGYDGNAVASDFTMSASGSNISLTSFQGSASGTTLTLDAGQYSVTENPADGFTASYSADCSGSIDAGATKYCTVTNTEIPEGDDNDPPPQTPTGILTVVKVVINDNGGTSVVADFPLFIDSSSVTSGSSEVLFVGQHVVSETGSPDYVATFSGDCDANGVVAIASGDYKTCTITNDDKPTGGSAPQTGMLIVVTNVINDGGGEASPSSFLMTVGDGISTSSTFGGMSTPGFNMAYAPGAFAVNGSMLPSYTQTKSANCSGSILAGQTVTCVVTYTYQAPPPTGGNPNPPAPPTPPAPPVTDSATAPAPVPQVLGATDDDLPVTGMPAWTLAAVLLAAAPFLRRKRA